MGFTKRPFGGFPVDALVGDGDAVPDLIKILGNRLIAGLQETFYHHPGNGTVPRHDLVDDVFQDQRLLLVVFLGIAVAAVDHDGRNEVVPGQHFLGIPDVVRIVVGLLPPAQDDVNVGVAGGLDDGGEPVTVDAEEGVGVERRNHGIDGDLEVAVGAVFEADREGEAAGQFAVGLGFGGAGADCAPAEHVRQVFGGDRVEHLGRNRKFQFGHFAEKTPGDTEPLGDQVAAVHVGIVDEPLPADRWCAVFRSRPS